MKNKILFLLIVSLFLVVPYSEVFSQEKESNALESYLEEALTNNPKIKQVSAKLESAQFKIKQAGSLPNPNVSYGHFIESVETRVGPQKRKVGFSQKIPFPGKLKYKSEIQKKEVKILKQELDAIKQNVMAQVKVTYYDLFWIDKAIQISIEEKEILEKTEKVAQRKYESNQATQQNVIKLQVELSRIIKKIYLLEKNRAIKSAKLKSLLDRPVESQIEKILHVNQIEFDYELKDLLGGMSISKQELIAADVSVEKAKDEKMLARMSYFPDITFGAEYTDIKGGLTSSIDDGQDAWMAKVTFSVPIWFGVLSSQVKEKQKTLDSAIEKRAYIENEVELEVQDAFFNISAYKDIIALYETALMPQARQAFDVSQSGFETGSISFLDWLDAERTYLQIRLAYYKAIKDYNKSIAFIEKAIGKSF